jgi:hypothetical protein
MVWLGPKAVLPIHEICITVLYYNSAKENAEKQKGHKKPLQESQS